MVSYKLDKYDKYFVAFILVIINLFNIGQCFASEEITDDGKEYINFSVLEDAVLSLNSHTIISNNSYSLYYLELEKGYTYYIDLDYITDSRIGYSDSIDIDSPVYNIIGYSNSGHLTMTINANDSNYIFFDYSQNNNYTPNYTVYRVRNAGISNAVNDLVENVGPQQLWSVFESGIDFIGVVVLVAFGLFLIVLLIKKLSKGKSDF